MKTRSHEYGDCNMIGRRVEQLRKARGIKQRDFIARLQVEGLDINPTSYSKLEGQVRIATDKELFTIAKVLQVNINELFRSFDDT
ncbi:MAG: helix-turn-helix transcriptional regulator [Clostridia bacterium]|nr:helix-turn-helix transcriptional regulator [Clostridia bacterium]